VTYPESIVRFAARTEREVRVMARGPAIDGEVAAESAADANGAGKPGTSEIVTFPDLVRAHRAWEIELYGTARDNRKPDRELERELHRRWRPFEDKYGQIETAYWSVRDASAVAFSVKKIERWPQRFRRGHERIPRFHRATDWATRDEPQIAGALDECETLAVRVEEILRGPSELIALRRVTAVASQLLGYVDRAWGREAPAAAGLQAPDWVHQAQCKEFVDEQRRELEQVEHFYKRTGNGQGKILFFWGMVQGLLALALVTAVTVAVTWPVDRLDGGATHWGELQLFVISVMAGALGAFLSVLSRMASVDETKFALDFEVGRANVRWLGVYRPFVGGIFGVATFLTLASGILQTQSPDVGTDFAYYGILAFFSGFFERFTKLPTGDLPTKVEEGKAGKGGQEGKGGKAGKAGKAAGES
jgi:hypothetical protein